MLCWAPPESKLAARAAPLIALSRPHSAELSHYEASEDASLSARQNAGPGGRERDGHGSGDLERRDWLDHLWSSDEAKVGDGVGRSGGTREI